MIPGQLSIPKLYNFSADVTVGPDSLYGSGFGALTDKIRGLPSGNPALFTNSNSNFTITLTAKQGVNPVIDKVKVYQGDAFTVDNVTVSILDKDDTVIDTTVTISSMAQGSATTFAANVFEFNNPSTIVNKILIRCNSGFGNGTSTILTELEIFGREGIQEIEFNDSVLDTKAWNSSRFDGRQLTASKINNFTEGDKTFARTPVIQSKSRNIYLGSRVIGMETGSIEDNSLLNIPGFSYVTVNEFITVHDDLSVTRHTVRGDKENIFTKKKGFYQSWYDDFPIGSTVEIKMMDKKLQQSLRPNYKVFNNSGQLQKLIFVEHGIELNPDSGSNYNATFRQDSGSFFYSGSGTDLGATFTIFNDDLLIQEFFTGSLIATPPAYVPGGSAPASDFTSP